MKMFIANSIDDVCVSLYLLEMWSGTFRRKGYISMEGRHFQIHHFVTICPPPTHFLGVAAVPEAACVNQHNISKHSIHIRTHLP